MIRLITCSIDSLPHTAIHIRINLNLLSYIWIKTRIMILDICFIWNKVISNITSGVCTRLTSLFPSLVSSHHAIRPPLTIVLFRTFVMVIVKVGKGYSDVGPFSFVKCLERTRENLFGVQSGSRWSARIYNCRFFVVACGKEWNFISFNTGIFPHYFVSVLNWNSQLHYNSS